MRDIFVPEEIGRALDRGATLVVSVSGGKDGQAMLNALTKLHRKNGWRGEISAVHAHLGRTEWAETEEHCRRICAAAGVELTIVSRPQGDLLARWQERMEKLKGTGKPFWSSAKNRYCTSDLKRGPINKDLRRYRKVISAEGIRADESPARAKKPVWSVREAITTRDREAWTWNPVLDWQLSDVWEACGTSQDELMRRRILYRSGSVDEALDGWPCHPAYVRGNTRLSCSICVLASRSDIVNGARHNQDLYRTLVGMERESGFSFRQDFSLESLEAEVL